MKKVIYIYLFLLGTQIFAQKKTVQFPLGFYNKENTIIYGLSLGFTQGQIKPYKKTTISNGLRIEPFGQGMFIFFSPNENFPSYKEAFSSEKKILPTEIINGINISTGTITYANVNGISLSTGIQTLRKMNGISFGFTNFSYKTNGIQIGLYGAGCEKLNGISIGSNVSSVINGNGIQIAGFNNAVIFNGIQIGSFNNLDDKNEKITGIQIGFHNRANKLTGIQIGLYNKTNKLRGIQLGLWNKNNKRSLPFINWNFNN